MPTVCKNHCINNINIYNWIVTAHPYDTKIPQKIISIFQ